MKSSSAIIAFDDGHAVLAEKANEILKVATELFYERDFNSVGMRLIASESGVRGASLYHYFESKEQMLFAIVLEVTRDFITDHLPSTDVKSDFEKQMQTLVEQHISYFWEFRHALSVGYREMHNLTIDHQEVVQKYRLQYQHGIQKFIKAGKDAGVFHCEDHQLAGLAILDLVNSVNEWFRPTGRLSIEQLAKKYGQLALQMLGVQNESHQ
jgi:AcrR family transcriptional regulator